MTTPAEIKEKAITFFEDAKFLFENEKYPNSIYLGGYSIELALKSIIVKNYSGGFPWDDTDFNYVKNSRNHDLTKLLKMIPNNYSNSLSLAGNDDLANSWQTVIKWTPEKRYSPITNKDFNKDSVKEFLDSIKKVLDYLFKDF